MGAAAGRGVIVALLDLMHSPILVCDWATVASAWSRALTCRTRTRKTHDELRQSYLSNREAVVPEVDMLKRLQRSR